MTTTTIRDEIVDYIKRNRVSSTEIADVLGKSGAIENIRAVNPGHFRVAPVKWVYLFEESNWPLHEQIADIDEGHVIVVDTFDCNGRAAFGDIVAKYLLLYRQSEAVVVSGNVRDAHRLIKENWPIWCEGFNPVGCFNRKPTGTIDENRLAARRAIYEGSIAVCDDTGVVIVAEHEQTEDFVSRLEFIEEQEDIWYECIDRRKWSTYKTICEKAYLT